MAQKKRINPRRREAAQQIQNAEHDREVIALYRDCLHGIGLGRLAELAEAERTGRCVVQERNDPLTLDELRQMDGEPVWIASGRFWALVNTHSFGYIALIENSGEIAKAKGWMKHMGAIYRRKPED